MIRMQSTLFVISTALLASAVNLRAQDLSALKGIMGQEALSHLKFLASRELRGRETFTQEQLVAGRYIANEFERYGLLAIDSSKTFFQEINYGYAKVSAQNLLELHGKTFMEGKDYQIAAVGANSLEAEVVFIGYGVTVIGYDSYDGVDARGKIVMIFEGNFPGKGGSAPSIPSLLVGNAISHGAAGMIFVRGTSPNNKKQEIASELSIASLGFPIALASKMGICRWSDEVWKKWFEFAFAYVSTDVANDLLGKGNKTIADLKKGIDDSGTPNSFALGQRLKICADVVHIGSRRTMNVVGLVEGSDPTLRNQVVIVGAHYDHIGVAKDSIGIPFGADDNASGTAALLEIAQAFAECLQKPKRSMLFIAFTGEEKGLIGSQYYVDHPLIPLSQTVTMINLDMVGRNDPGAIKVASQGIPEETKRLVQRSAKEAGLKIEFLDEIWGSDQSAFFLKDIPSMWFFDGGGDFGHGTTDSWDKISVEKLGKVARLCFLTAYRIADEN